MSQSLIRAGHAPSPVHYIKYFLNHCPMISFKKAYSIPNKPVYAAGRSDLSVNKNQGRIFRSARAKLLQMSIVKIC